MEQQGQKTPYHAPNDTPANTEQPETPVRSTQKQGSRGPIGPIVGTVIIIALLLFGALYFWGAYLNNAESQDTPPLILSGDNTNGIETHSTTTVPRTSNSDEVSAIEQDVENTDYAAFEASMEAELEALEAALNSN